ncbi:MAG: beta-propeller domain-containing protein [Patescibacteria group bacterium]
MDTTDIKAWITSSRQRGTTDAQIRQQLLAAGWHGEQVDQVLKETGAPASTEDVTRLILGKSPENTNPKKWLWPVVAVVVVGVIGGGVYFSIDRYGLPWQNTNGKTGTNKVQQYTGVTPTSFADQLAAQNSLGHLKDYQELRDFLETHTSGSDDYSSFGSSRNTTGVSESLTVPTGIDLPASDSIGTTLGLGTADLKSTTSSDYSTTNIQVAGVDEADIIKSDGRYLYIVSGTTVKIVDAYPAATAATVSTITLDSAPQGLYLAGDRLVIYGAEQQMSKKSFYQSVHRYSDYTFVRVYNVADRKNPQLARDLTFEGDYQSSRLVGDYVYLVTVQASDQLLDEDVPLPLVVENGAVLPTDPGTPRCNCPDLYYVEMPGGGYVYTTVTAINVQDTAKAVSGDAYLLSSSQTLYVSPSNIYLVYTKQLSQYELMMQLTVDIMSPQLTAREQQRLAEINTVSDRVLSRGEKLMKTYTILMRHFEDLTDEESKTYEDQMKARAKVLYADLGAELEKTVIHRIAIDKDKLEYRGSGSVTGHVLNQFSMDEDQGYFRIATTKSRAWSDLLDDSTGTQESYSNVYVLDGKLQVVGKVEQLAKGEQIYAARFMQGRVYLVTFRQTDPLFVIDLSTPTAPKVLGQLKVPGFSSYLHPYDETTLIGFGKQADEQGRVTGLKLSLFDVSDVANMKEIDTYVMGDSGSDSIALQDHKAFLFSKSKNLLVVPVTLRQQQTDKKYTSTYQHGAMVLSITKDGFTFRKRIDHSDGSAGDSKSIYRGGYSYYDTSVQRSLYIQDTLYTLSQKYLKANSLDTLDEQKSITLVETVATKATNTNSTNSSGGNSGRVQTLPVPEL